MVKNRVYTKENLAELKWEEYQNGVRLKTFFIPLISQGPEHYVENVHGKMGLVACEKILIPFVLGKYKRKKTAYVASNISQYIDYAEDEIGSNKKYPFIARIGAPLVFGFFRNLARVTGFDQAIFINTYLLSTNLFLSDLPKNFGPAIEALQKAYPNRVLVFKSVCQQTHKNLYNKLLLNGFKPMLSRQVYLIKKEETHYVKKRPFQQDQKRWEKVKKDFNWVEPESLSLEAAHQLIDFYKDLYIKKYSTFNPTYTPAFATLVHNSGVLRFEVLEYKNTVVGVQAISKNQFEVNTPFIGYDQTVPQKVGLYRHLNLRLMQIAKDKDLLLNMSSGAAKFKKQRGGKPAFEYNMVYDKGVGAIRKTMFWFFRWFGERFVKPGMQKFEV